MIVGMKIIERAMADKIKKYSKFRKVILITGSRQIGKTTLLKEIKEKERNYVSLDDLNIRTIANKDPK